MLSIETYKIEVRGYVVAKQRPRFSNGHAYTPTTTKEAEHRIAEEWRRQIYPRAWDHAYADGPCDPIMRGPVELNIAVYLRRPKLHYRTAKGHELELKPNAPHYPTGKPDWDNLAKTATDALNGVAWRDDSQVVRASVEKRYGVERWEIEVVPLGCCGAET